MASRIPADIQRNKAVDLIGRTAVVTLTSIIKTTLIGVVINPFYI